jgi:hypothetical protein
MTSSYHFARPGRLLAALAAGTLLMLAGCSNNNAGGPAPADASTAAAKPPPADGHDAEVQPEREKLSADDRALVDAQEWCAINTGERLGSMGPPLKVVVKDQPVFLCCKGCQRKALADPDKTLAAVAELTAKAKAGRERK